MAGCGEGCFGQAQRHQAQEEGDFTLRLASHKRDNVDILESRKGCVGGKGLNAQTDLCRKSSCWSGVPALEPIASQDLTLLIYSSSEPCNGMHDHVIAQQKSPLVSNLKTCDAF